MEIFREIADTRCNLVFEMKMIPLLFGGPAARKQTLKDVKAEAPQGKIQPFGEGRFLLHHDHRKMSLSSAHTDGLTQRRFLNAYYLLTTPTYQKCFMGGDKLAKWN